MIVDDKPDWEAIQREYETSDTPYEKIAEKYGVNANTLYSRSRKWRQDSRLKNRVKKDPDSRIEHPEGPIRVLRSELPTPASTLKGANLIVEDLVEILEEQRKKKAKLEIADYLKITNALFQCNRIIVNALPESGEEEDAVLTIDTRDLSTSDLASLKKLALGMKEGEHAG